MCLLCQSLSRPDHQPPDPIRPATRGSLCQVHLDTLRRILLDIARLYAHVSSAGFLREQRDRDAERWVGSKAPTDCQALSVLDYRTRALVPGDPISVSRVLKVWTYAILDTLAQESMITDGSVSFAHDAPMPHQSVPNYILLHVQMLPWLADHPTVVVRYARHMAAIRRQLLRLVPQY